MPVERGHVDAGGYATWQGVAAHAGILGLLREYDDENGVHGRNADQHHEALAGPDSAVMLSTTRLAARETNHADEEEALDLHQACRQRRTQLRARASRRQQNWGIAFLPYFKASRSAPCMFSFLDL